MKRNLITAALPYANGFIHLGHCAGAYIPADTYARFLRLCGEQTLFVCGSDEHGVAITISAETEGVAPRQVIDKYHASNSEAFSRLGMSFDIYSRTSEPEHTLTAQEFFLDWRNKGLLVEHEEGQFYDETAKMFLPDRYVEGVCPNCGSDKARGDQCENCGAYYNQTDLLSPKSKVTGQTPVIRQTKHWYFKLNQFQKAIEDYVELHAARWKDNVLQQTRSWLKQGLAERAATRDLDWGVPAPLKDADGKVIYVWFEAVLGYISATKIWAKQQGAPDSWRDWWKKSEDNSYTAFLGKDNIVFHTIIFPIILMAGDDYVLPENVPANEFLNFEGQKFSKSRNWGVYLRDFQRDFTNPAQIDALRYTIAANLPETRDSDFSWKDFQAKNNNELAAVFGNFVNRTLQFLHKYFGGRVPSLSERFAKLPDAWSMLIEDLQREHLGREAARLKYESQHLRYFNSQEFAMISSLEFGVRRIAECYRTFHFREALLETMNTARAANKFFNDAEPWKTLKTDPEQCAKTLYICSQIVRSLAILFAPIIPFSAAETLKILDTDNYTGAPDPNAITNNRWLKALYPTIESGACLAQPKILFEKIEDATIEQQLGKMGSAASNRALTDNLIEIDDFRKIQLRVGRVVAAERIQKSEKLLKVRVDIGGSERQILAGIAKFYSPDDLIGKSVVVVVNLKPAKLMGLESQGMLLAANDAEGNLSLIAPESVMQSGAEVR